MASRPAPASATVGAITPEVESPAQPSARMGPCEIRPREGLSPTQPHQDAGMRTLPPPSVAWAKAQRPAATAAAAPPLDPPVLCSGFQGLRAAPCSPCSVVGREPNSGVFVLSGVGQTSSLCRPYMN